MSALTKVSLLGLFVVGAATLHGLSISTGFYDLVASHKSRGVLSDGTLYDPNLTGVAAVDDLVGTLVQFFWPCADGSAPGLTLLSLLFTGQFSAFFVIWLLEGHRAGNKGKFISYVSLYGLLFQGAGIGVIAPAWLLATVFTSPTLNSPSPANLAISSAVLSGIPFALTFGFFPPTIFMSLPAPGVISLATKVKAIAFWQPSPVYVTSLLFLWTSLSGSSSPKPVSSTDQLKKLRTVYKYGLGIAVPAHAAVWGLSLTAYLLPQIYAPTIAASLHPLAALIPGNPLAYATTTVSSLAQGSQSFLQWDYLVASTAYLIYSVNARFNKKVEPKGFSAADAAGLTARLGVLGPMGTALSLLWERDEIVFGKEEGQKKLR